MIQLSQPACLALCLILLKTLGSCEEGYGREVGERPNFILVVCDNLGYGDIEPFGSQLCRTPNLNTMAIEGRKFTHFYVTAGVCTPSRASILTGKYAQRVGMHMNPRDGHVLRPVSPYGLAQSEITIAEQLKQYGYSTAIIGKWHLGDQAEFLPTRQGFDRFFGIPYSDDMTRPTGIRIAKGGNSKLDGEQWPPLPLMENERVVEAPVDRRDLTNRYTAKALEFISDHRDEPFFLYLPHAMPGSTAEPFASESFRGKSQLGAWGDSVEELDWSIGQILGKLKALGLAENTLVIWTSDNGAPLAAAPNRSDPSNPRKHRGSNGHLHGRGYTTSEGAFRVPMIAWWPGRIPADSQCDSLATTLDFLPTMLALNHELRPELLDEIELDGFDLSDLMFNESKLHRSRYAGFCYYERDQLQAVRQGDWKLFLPLQNWQRHPHFQKGQAAQSLLFDLRKDPSCQHNVAADHPEIVERMLEYAESKRSVLGDRGQMGTGQNGPGKISGIPKPQVIRAASP